MNQKKINSILPYFGGKRTLAPRIVAEMGAHKAYCEPCCGSLAVLMAKREAPFEVANDLYGSVINLARVIASTRWRDLVRRLARCLYHESLFAELKERVRESEHLVAPSVREVEDEHVEAAFAFFVRAWMGRNGAAGTVESNATMARRFTSNGGSGGLRWHGAMRSVGAWHERLARVQFARMNMLDLIERVDDADGWVYYVDPPYLRKGAKYVHDFGPEDHERLARILNEKRCARVLVSYYEEPELEHLYPPDRWTRVRMPVAKGLVNGSGRAAGRVEAPEVVLINGPSLTAGLFEGGAA